MSIINTKLVTPRNIAVIGILSIVAHYVANPLYKMVANRGDNSGE